MFLQNRTLMVINVSDIAYNLVLSLYCYFIWHSSLNQLKNTVILTLAAEATAQIVNNISSIKVEHFFAHTLKAH